MQPAYLNVEELQSGALRVTWQVPLNQSLPARFGPAFPESFKSVPPEERVETSTAVVRSWTMVGGAGGLDGAKLGILGLAETAMDTLVRVQFRDGSLHRVVLRPTTPFTTLPSSGATLADANSPSKPIVQAFGRWRYVLLFIVALGLSLTLAARRRGILLCTLALIVGSLVGQGLTELPLREQLSRDPLPSDNETKRIVSGLMLNTYRAFMLEDDEQIYDVLSRSVAGELLNTIYLQNRETFRMDPDDAALSLVNRLDVKTVESVKPMADGAISMVVEWDVYGSVYHWEHVHFRCNTYKAELSIAPMDGYWKLTRLQLLDGKRVI
jgi:hypothetical protein